MNTESKPHVRVVAAEIEQDGAFLITQRRPEARLPLLWEFPGGRVEAGETDAQALMRELREEMAIEVEVGDVCLQVTHEYDDYSIDLIVCRCKIVAGEPQKLRVHDLRWVRPENFSEYTFPGADQQSVDALLADADERAAERAQN